MFSFLRVQILYFILRVLLPSPEFPVLSSSPIFPPLIFSSRRVSPCELLAVVIAVVQVPSFPISPLVLLYPSYPRSHPPATPLSSRSDTPTQHHAGEAKMAVG